MEDAPIANTINPRLDPHAEHACNRLWAVLKAAGIEVSGCGSHAYTWSVPAQHAARARALVATLVAEEQLPIELITAERAGGPG